MSDAVVREYWVSGLPYLHGSCIDPSVSFRKNGGPFLFFFFLSPSEHFIFTRDTHLSSSRVARTDDFLIQETRNIRHEKENGIVHRKRRYTAVVLSAGKSVSAPELSWRVVSVEEATLRSRPACVSLCL